MSIDILLSKTIPPVELETTLVDLLGFESNVESVVVSNVVPNSKLPAACHLLVIATEVKGQMRQNLELYFQHGHDANIDLMHLVFDLSDKLNCNLLISDSDVNPYSRVQIGSDGQISIVLLDAVELDENDRYFVLPRVLK